MADNINKVLYLGVGVMLLVIALTAFYQYETRFYEYKYRYQQIKDETRTWLKAGDETMTNPLKIVVHRDEVGLDLSLIYTGLELKSLLTVQLYNEESWLLVYEGKSYENQVDSQDIFKNLLGELGNKEVYKYFFQPEGNVYSIERVGG